MELHALGQIGKIGQLLGGMPVQVAERPGEMHGVLAGAAADFQDPLAPGKANPQYLEYGILVAFAGCGEGKHMHFDFILNRYNFRYSGGPVGPMKEMSMSISMYDFSIPVLTRGLTNLSAMLDKAAAHAAAKKFDSVALAQARLF